MRDCPLSERSARGYCPEDAGQHAAEVEHVAEVDATAETEAPAPVGTLPHTGGDPLSAVVGLAALAVGAWTVRRTT